MGLARTKSAARFFIWANCPATLEAISPGSRRLRLCRRASAWAPRNSAVCAKLAHLHISPNRLACVSAYGCIVWGEDKTRFFPDYSPVRFEQKGVVAQMVERPLCMRKVGGSMPSYSNSYFAFFLLTGSRSKPEKRAMTPACDPIREKSHVSRFFVSLSGRLFPRFGQSGTVVAQSERRLPSFGRESWALRVTCE